ENDYNLMLEVLNELYQITGEQKYLAELFTYMEKSKASVLLSSITESKAKVTANIPDSILKREQYLNSRINGLKKLVYDEKQKSKNTNQEQVNEWENLIFELQNDYQELTEYIKKNYYEFYRLQLKPEIMTLEETVEKLDKNQAIIAYSFLEDKTLTLLVTKDFQKLHVEPVAQSEIDSLISAIRAGLTVDDFANFDNADYRRFVRSTRKLYKHLLEPVENNIKNKKLVFIPDGKLGFIPLEILLTQPVRNSGQMNFKTLPYLINEYAISYAYSVTLLLTEHNKTVPGKNKVFSMAPAYENISRMPVDSLFVKRSQSTILMPLEGAKQEVKNINEIFRSDSWMDKKATEQNFIDNATDYAILHLAMHTILDDANPMYSKLVFYQEEEPENDEDNLLNTYELFDLTLNAELAVLSACNTGYGKLQRGEGIMSLARGFLYAGVPSIMMTLWPIDDAATADMMQYFYQNLAEGMEKDIALRQAKLDFLESSGMLNSHPHFWASFVSIGPDDAISHTRSKTTTHWWIITGTILAAVLAFFIIKKIRTKG
ncbi:MAG: CHAT domain-containing protein, partial [Bacteroidota bacterium]